MGNEMKHTPAAIMLRDLITEHDALLDERDALRAQNAVLREALESLSRLHDGGQFDLTDSPKSYMSTVKRVCADALKSCGEA